MIKRILLIVLFACLYGCGGKSNNAQPSTPAAASLQLPAQNGLCISGNIISPTESDVTFVWNAANNTNSYQLVVKNLLTAANTIQSTTQTQLSLTLLRNTPYSWYIISKSAKGATAQSDIWKFYNSGPGVVDYAPFPADLVSPALGTSVTATNGLITLSWKGTSVNQGTILNYDVYFGANQSPPLLQSDVTNSFINNISVVSGTVYYWHVVTRDLAGNTSDSGVEQFSVN